MKKLQIVMAVAFALATMNVSAHEKGEKCKGGKACCKKEMAMKKKSAAAKMAMVSVKKK